MLKIINNALKIPLIPIIFKLFTFIVFTILVYIGINANSSDQQLLKELRNTNIANLLVWSYWWPLIIVGAIFFGRIWCFTCPVELITSIFAKIGFKYKRPKIITSGWIMTIFYILILFIGIQVLKIHRNPAMMAWYLLSIIFVSIIIGLIFEKNTFCRYICPVGYLLGLYSRLSFFGWRVNDKTICTKCKDKSCIKKDYQYNLIYKSCGVDIYPGKLDDNTNCILCTSCLKSCNKYNPENIEGRPNPGFSIIGFSNDIYKHKSLSLAEVAFLFVVSGFVISEILSEWNTTNSFINIIPDIIKQNIDAQDNLLKGLIESVVIFIFYPMFFWVLPYLFLISSKLKFSEYLRNYGVAFIPIMAFAHLCKSILKMSSRIPYFQYSFNDPTGIETAKSILNKVILINPIPDSMNYIVTLLLTISITIGIYISIKIIRNLNLQLSFNSNSFKFTYIIPIFYGGLFVATIIIWRWISLI